MSIRHSLCCLAAGVACSLSLARAATLVSYPDFTSTAGLTLVGNATTAVTSDGTVLRATPASTQQSGAAYSTIPVILGANDTFSTTFRFRFTGTGGINPADGIVFVLGATASGIGSPGGGIGYAHVPNSVGIEFDTYNNAFDDDSSNHVSVNSLGNLANEDLASAYGIALCDFSALHPHSVPGCMSNGDLWTVNINYDGSKLTVSVKDSAMPASFTAINAIPLNLASILGTNSAFVGFTSGTGDGFENHDILSWQFSNVVDPGTPEPASLGCVGAALAGLAWFRLRKRA